MVSDREAVGVGAAVEVVVVEVVAGTGHEHTQAGRQAGSQATRQATVRVPSRPSEPRQDKRQREGEREKERAAETCTSHFPTKAFKQIGVSDGQI